MNSRKNKVIAAIFILCIFVISFIFLTRENQVVTNFTSYNIPTTPTIVMIGDSLVEGYGARKGNSLPEQVGSLIDTPIINLGVSGNTTEDVLQRIDDVPENTYLTIVIAGGNDVLKRIPEEETLANLRNIVAHLHAQGSIVAIASVKSSIFGEGSLTAKYKKIAEQSGSIYLVSILSDVYGNDSLMSDNIHPNTQGYAVIAEKIAATLSQYVD